LLQVKQSNMETTASVIESLIERVEIYGKTTYELTKLKLLESTISVVTFIIARLTVVILISMFALVLSIGAALMLGEVLGKLYYGFFIVAAFYLVTGLVLHFFLPKWIKKPVSELIINQAFK
jgi:hypothetical protein